MQDTPFDAVAVDADTLKAVTEKVFPVQNDAAGEEMQATIAAAKENADSVGGVIECAVVGLPVGVGELCLTDWKADWRRRFMPFLP